MSEIRWKRGDVGIVDNYSVPTRMLFIKYDENAHGKERENWRTPNGGVHSGPGRPDHLADPAYVLRLAAVLVESIHDTTPTLEWRLPAKQILRDAADAGRDDFAAFAANAERLAAGDALLHNSLHPPEPDGTTTRTRPTRAADQEDDRG